MGVTRNAVDYRGICGDLGFRPEPMVKSQPLATGDREVIERELAPVSFALIEPQACRPDLEREREEAVQHYQMD